MKTYYLHEKNKNNFKKYTLDELKKFFSIKDTDESDTDYMDKLMKIKNIDEMEDFIENYVNNEGGVHYHDYYIEETQNIKAYTELMREDLGLSRIAFSKKYNIPIRTLEAWASGVREAPEYVIDLLGRAVYSDMNNKKPVFYVVAIGKHDEWDCGKFDSYMDAVKTASDEWENRTPSYVLNVEIRLYVADVEDEDCDNFNCDLVSFK